MAEQRIMPTEKVLAISGGNISPRFMGRETLAIVLTNSRIFAVTEKGLEIGDFSLSNISNVAWTQARSVGALSFVVDGRKEQYFKMNPKDGTRLTSLLKTLVSE